MADFLQKIGLYKLCFADHNGDFNPLAVNTLYTGSPLTVELGTAGLADGAAKQSEKIDLGYLVETNAPLYNVVACLEFAATPTAGEKVEFYWAPSPTLSTGYGNPGGVSGLDSTYTGDSSNLAAAIKQLQHIGNFICTDVETSEDVQKGYIGTFRPKERYGSLSIKTESGENCHSADDQNHILFEPIVETAV
jgi:hypothetical protein